MQKLLALAIVAFAVGLTPAALAQTPAGGDAAPAAPAQDPNSVEVALQTYVAAFNKHDANALAELWTPEGLYVDKETGQRSEGREALAADFRALFAASPNLVLSGNVEDVRALADGVAMVDGTSLVSTSGEEPSMSAFSAIFKRVAGKWLLDSVHETPVPTPESSRQALEPLAWMVGHWQDQADAGQVDTVARWSPSEAFIIRSYNVAREGEVPFEGTQIIGWDARGKHIRSWTFNSDGSFGEGVWSRNQDEWLVRTSQTLADGRAATATQVIKQLDANSATVQTIGKEVDGSLEPASEPITVVRIAEAPAADPTAPTGAPAPTTTSATGPAATTEALP